MVGSVRARILGSVLVAATILLLTGCQAAIGSVSGPVHRATLTSLTGMTYDYVGSRSGLFALPGQPDTDGNVREVFWYPDSVFTADQESCVTWNIVAGETGPGLLQPGVALRIAPVTADNRGIKAVTITQNIWYAGVWMFNVHVWNSLNTAQPFTQIATFDLSSIVGSYFTPGGITPSPWHICARARGDTVGFILWTGADPKPSWKDPSRVHSATLPAGWDYEGYAGGYIGHLHPGQAGAFSNLNTWRIR